jgi:hypothetical protein
MGCATTVSKASQPTAAGFNSRWKYAIALQDVPLLCRRFLEEQDESGRKRAVMFTEQDMRRYADTQASAREAAAQRRRPHRAPVSNKVGQAWRGPQV